jgi:hypothetical protein
MFTRIALTASLAAATLFATAQDAAAQRRGGIRPQGNRQQDIDIGIGPIRIEIGDGWIRPRPGPGPGPGPGPRPEPRPVRPETVYVVTEYNPITGGVYSTRRFTKQSDAYNQRDAIARVHWVKWRFAGINEPLRSRRFANGAAAQNFINTDGPSKTGAAGFAILTNETRAVPTRVTITTREVQD